MRFYLRKIDNLEFLSLFAVLERSDWLAGKQDDTYYASFYHAIVSGIDNHGVHW